MSSIIKLLRVYYRLVGKKLFLLLFLMLAAVGFQGLSLSLFLPILQGETADSKITQIIRGVFVFFGLEYTLLYLLLFLVIFFFLRSVFLVGQASLIGKITAEMLVALRYRVAEKIFRLDYQAFLKKSSGYLNNALVVEFQNVLFSFKMFSSLLAAGFFAMMYIGFSLFLNPVLVLILIGVGIPFFAVIKNINALTKDYSIKTSQHSAGLQKILIQSLNYFKYLKATSRYPKALEQILHQSKALGKTQFRLSILGAITQHAFEPFVVLIIASVILYYAVSQGQGVVMTNLFLLYLLYSAMIRILGMQTNYRKLLNSWGSIKVLEALEAELEELKEEMPEESSLQHVDFAQPICLKDVGFRFHNGVEVLRDINAEIPPNSTVAFVGESGVGKTTLVNILTGLFLPTEGDISVGDVSYRNIHRDSIRGKIGYITQENVIFNDTIYNNITLWDADRSDKNRASVESVSEKAHIAEFICGLKDGYDTVLGEGGIDISGGQRQRICIARELFKNTKVLIFDEATSSLDTGTEREIQKNIDEFKGHKTIILIAHRLSTVRNCDKIFVLKNATIVEEGSYHKLCAANSEFSRMVKQQNY